MNIEKIIPTDFSGCVSIYQKEEMLFQKAYGYADLSNKVFNDIETRFATASAGKIFVAVGILQLVENGKLHLEDKVGTLFDFDWEQIDSEITVEQLLTHTSGIPDYPCNMTHTGYYELDRLPAKCAFNYISDRERNDYRTNIYSVDAKGTGAGGAFTTIGDIRSFWENLLSYQLLSPAMTKNMLSNHSGENQCYGYGVWLKKAGNDFNPHFEGCDPGVSFISAFDKENQILVTLVSNYGDNVWKLRRDIAAKLLLSASKKGGDSIES